MNPITWIHPRKFGLQTDIQGGFCVYIGRILTGAGRSAIRLNEGYHKNFRAAEICHLLAIHANLSN
jgi:hypothetical protein